MESRFSEEEVDELARLLKRAVRQHTQLRMGQLLLNAMSESVLYNAEAGTINNRIKRYLEDN